MSSNLASPTNLYLHIKKIVLTWPLKIFDWQTMLSFRYATPDDGLALAQITARSLQRKDIIENRLRQGTNPATLANFKAAIDKDLEDPTMHTLIAHDGTRDAGYLTYTESSDAPGKIYISDLYALKSSSGPVGKSLLRELICNKNDLIDVSLRSFKSAISFYLENGFDLENEISGMSYMFMNTENIHTWQNTPKNKFPVFQYKK